MPPTCPDCGAFRATAVCPVCQQFAPVPRWPALAGRALLCGLVGAIAVAGFAGLLALKWARWVQQFGEADSPPVRADALNAAAGAGLSVFAVASLFDAAVLALRTPRPRS